MADGSFDPCECLFSHEQAMQRLINLLRSSQSVCTDSECYQELPGIPGLPIGAGGDFKFFLFLIGWLVLAVTLYFLRPGRQRSSDDTKPRNNQGPSSPPPDNSIY